MVKRLSIPEQRKMYKALPQSRHIAVKKYCCDCSMKGEGIMDILKKIGEVLGPIAKELGPVVLKEIIVPFLKNKMSGNGLGLPGNGLKLAGQRGKGKKIKK